MSRRRWKKNRQRRDAAQQREDCAWMRAESILLHAQPKVFVPAHEGRRICRPCKRFELGCLGCSTPPCPQRTLDKHTHYMHICTKQESINSNIWTSDPFHLLMKISLQAQPFLYHELAKLCQLSYIITFM